MIDNNLKNLEWVTAQENTVHAINTGLLTYTSRMGTNSYTAKLDVFKVLTMRTFYKKGWRNKYQIKYYQEKYRVGYATAHNAIKGKTWGDKTIFLMLNQEYAKTYR